MTIPSAHVSFLNTLKKEHSFVPLVIYDIGAYVMDWTKVALEIWPHSRYYLVEANQEAEKIYKANRDIEYAIEILGDEDGREVKYYESKEHPNGNSYYREIYFSNTFPKENFTVRKLKTLTTLVIEKGWPLPTLIKIDVQGAELDVLKGALPVLQKVKYLIVELQSENYNENAPKADQVIEYLSTIGFNLFAPKFSDHGPDADYCFVRA